MSRPEIKRQAQKNLAGLARSHTEKALLTLVSAMDSDDERVRVDAASRILDRGYGKPAQSVEVMGDEDGGPVQHCIQVEFVRPAS
jgi:hypothetical protein